MVGVLDVDAELLERQDGLAAHVRARVESRQVEVAALVQRLGRSRLGPIRAEVKVLELRPDEVVVEAHRLGSLERAAHDPARVALIRLATGHPDVAEHARRAVFVLRAPRNQPAGRRIGHRDHVRLLDRVEPGDRGAVEPHPALEGVVELLGVDREALQLPEEVREPEPNEADVIRLAVGDRLLRAGRGIGHRAETYPVCHIRASPFVVGESTAREAPLYLRGVSNRLKVK